MKDNKGLAKRSAVITATGFRCEEKNKGIVFYLKLDEIEITFPLDEGKESAGYKVANNLLDLMRCRKSQELIGKQVVGHFNDGKLSSLSVDHPEGGFGVISIPFYF